MKVSSRTIGEIGKRFAGGDGLSHADIERIWMTAGVSSYLPPGTKPSGSSNNKQFRVVTGLQNLREGFTAGHRNHLANREALNEVVSEITNELRLDLSDGSALSRSLIKDGMTTDDAGFLSAYGEDTPTRRLADHLLKLLEEDDRFEVALTHYAQGLDCFDRGAWESANGDFRSAFEAVFDRLAWDKGCPEKRSGGDARRWLDDHGYLDDEEAELLKAFGRFAHTNGSHPGLSDKSECQLRRHLVTALIVYGVARLG